MNPLSHSPPAATPSSASPPATAPPDADLAQQARPGHGVPSQDPDPAAQQQLDLAEAQRESGSALTGGAMMAGMATGAAIGVAVAGPVGVVVGASVGAMAGALGGAIGGAIGGAAATSPTATHPAATGPTAPAVHLHIEDTGGNGRPVLLIHGWPLSAQAWLPQVATLQAAGYRVVAYDRRGFGRSEQPESGYDFDTLADDLQGVIECCDLQDLTLVGFSMGGGEVARYIARWGEARLHSVVFAAAVTPYLLKTADNLEGPLTPEAVRQMKQGLEHDRDAFFERFTTDFHSAHGVLQVSESQRQEALALCHQSALMAAVACIDAFATTDFRADLKQVTVPTLVIHGTADAIVPIDGSGARTHQAVRNSQWIAVDGAPHGLNASHAQAFNGALLTFLRAATTPI